MHGRHGEAASCRNPAALRSSRWRARLELEPTSGKIKGFKGRCARDRPEIAKSRAPVMRSSQHEVLAAEITTAAGLRTPCFASEAGLPLLAPRWQILPGCCCTRQPSSFCLASHMRWECLETVAGGGLGHPLIVGCGAVLRTLRRKSRQKLRNTPTLRSKLEQRLSLSSAMEFSASEPSKRLSFTTKSDGKHAASVRHV